MSCIALNRPVSEYTLRNTVLQFEFRYWWKSWCCSEMPQLSGNRHAGQDSTTWPWHDAADPEYVPGTLKNCLITYLVNLSLLRNVMEKENVLILNFVARNVMDVKLIARGRFLRSQWIREWKMVKR